ncbi:MAG: PKD domain-containing protein, partial [Halobacteriales archaeon]
MKRFVVALFVVALVVASPSGVAADGDDNEAPLVDAGLDQQVDPGARVMLDGGATRDPDGRVVSYSWSIESPNGTTTRPACPTCERTSFRATQRGVYAVTLSATDDDGATATDTLYVTVAGESEPPSVTLDGPGSTTAGSAATFTASFAAGTADLDRVE